MSVNLDPNHSYIIIGNYGNDTLALIQWAVEHALVNVTVVSVDTGWAAPSWAKHVLECEARVREQGYQVVRLVSTTSFTNLIKQRGYFPTPKFQWCANVLKGAPILLWLDQHDPSVSARVLLGHRRVSARSKQNLPEHISESDSFAGRDVYYPLATMSTVKRDKLLSHAGVVPLTHRSLECDPCINSDTFDLSLLNQDEIQRLNELEVAVGKMMFVHLTDKLSDGGILNIIKNAEKVSSSAKSSDVLENMGCGDPYGCGI
ncbi:MAG: phosphoadenosine phosphosulfate reductase [Gammaproteobacteria bacterium]